MKVTMSLEQATDHVENTKPLKLKEIEFKIKPDIQEKNPSRFLVGAEPPFLCGTDWPDSGISEVVEKNNVPLDSLIMTDWDQVIATVYRDEISQLINWFKKLV